MAASNLRQGLAVTNQYGIVGLVPQFTNEDLEPAVAEAAKIIFSYVKACYPITSQQANRELSIQGVEWSKIPNLWKDRVFGLAVNRLIAKRKIQLCWDDKGDALFDLPE